MKNIFILLATTTLALLTPMQAADKSPLPPKEKYTILPIGDSITEGSGGSFQVYRYPLMEKLLAAGYPVEYIGSKTTHPLKNSPLGILKHDGYSGQNIAFLTSKIKDLYTQNPADIVLLQAGHNNSAENGNDPVPRMIDQTRKFIETIRTINPQATILIAQVIPSGKLPKYSYIPEFNKALIPLAEELNKTTPTIFLVNQYDGFNWETDTVGDHVHPNKQGAEKMALKWFQALKTILPTPKPATTTPAS